MAAPATTTLAVFPYYRDNPWQDLVYRGLVERGVQVVGVDEFFDVEGLRAQLHGRLPDAVHLGWSTPVTQTVADVAEAVRRVVRFTAAVRELRSLGVRVVWTVHNVLSHELHHVGPELAFHRHLAEIVDVVHVMNPRTPDIVAPLYRLPTARTCVLPHPSYRGVQAPRREARSGGTMRLLIFGEIRPYKGVVEFARLVSDTRRAGADVTLDVVGRVGGGMSVEAVAQAFSGLSGVTLKPGFVPESDVADVFAGADAVVLSHARGLNSGAALLAASHGVPVLVGRGLRDTWNLEPTWQVPLWSEDETTGDAAAFDHAIRSLALHGATLRRGARTVALETSAESLALGYAEMFVPTGVVGTRVSAPVPS